MISRWAIRLDALRMAAEGFDAFPHCGHVALERGLDPNLLDDSDDLPE